MSRIQVTKDFLGLVYRHTDYTESDIFIDANETFRILQRRYEETLESDNSYESAMTYLCDVFMSYCRKYCPSFCK